VQFDVERTTVAGRSALTVRGELDIATAPVLAAAVDAQLAGPAHALVLDLTPTRFIDSTGARGLVRAAKQAAAAGVALHVVCPRSNSAVRLVIDLLEMDQIVPIVESPADLGAARADGESRP
jgi:anti-anti-sigma factor